VRARAPSDARPVAAVKARRRTAPLDAATEAALAASVAAAHDDALAQALVKLGRAVTRARGGQG
jgi:hypothetical protein